MKRGKTEPSKKGRNATKIRKRKQKVTKRARYRKNKVKINE